jgi:hypothetical protein
MKVKMPSMMKIQAQPPLPPTPSMVEMALARRPPNAPAAVAAEKKIAMRKPHSWRLYHMVI